MSQLIYVVDDDAKIREIICKYLLNEGFRVESFDNAQDVLKAVSLTKPDLLVLDVMMPGIDGYEVCRQVRATSTLPIIFVSARDQELDRILGLELGGDDYLSKPFSPRELVVRVKTVLRRVGSGSGTEMDKLTSGDIVLCPQARRVSKGNTDLELTSKEFELLYVLMQNPNKAFTRDNLLNRIWGYNYPGDPRAVDDLVKRVRKKLKLVEAQLEIQTVWGFGYKLEGRG